MTNMLLGALLVAIGVLASALADRIRGLRLERVTERPKAKARAIEVTEQPPRPPTLPPALPATGPRPRAAKPLPAADGGADVIEAIVDSGYKRQAATAAVHACTLAERVTLESWTVAALRRCATGGAS